MLCLSRRLGETIVLDGGRIRITVVEICSNKIRLGVEAPISTVVDRLEVHEAKRTKDKEIRR